MGLFSKKKSQGPNGKLTLEPGDPSVMDDRMGDFFPHALDWAGSLAGSQIQSLAHFAALKACSVADIGAVIDLGSIKTTLSERGDPETEETDRITAARQRCQKEFFADPQMKTPASSAAFCQARAFDALILSIDATEKKAFEECVFEAQAAIQFHNWSETAPKDEKVGLAKIGKNGWRRVFSRKTPSRTVAQALFRRRRNG